MKYVLTWALLLCTLLAHAQSKSIADSLDQLIYSLPTAEEQCALISDIVLNVELYQSVPVDKRKEYAELGMQVAEEPRHWYGPLCLMVSYCLLSGQNAQAMHWAKTGLAKAESDPDSLSRIQGRADFHVQIGRVLHANGQEVKSLEHLLSAKRLYTELGEEKKLSIINGRIARILLVQGRAEDALELETASLRYVESTGDRFAILTRKLGIAKIMVDLGKLDSAMAICNEAMPVFMQDSAFGLLHQTVFTMVRAYRAKGEPATALLYCDTALAYAQASGEPIRESWCHEARALTLYELGDKEGCVRYLDQTLTIAKELDLKPRLSTLYFNLSEVHQELGNFELALDYKMLEAEINDSLDVIERAQRFSDIEAAYEMEKQEAANRILEQDNQIQALELSEKDAQLASTRTIWISIVAVLLLLAIAGFILQNQARTRRESQLAQQLAEVELKALRAQMNPHFTFNTMNSIQHYIEGRDIEAAKGYLAKFGRLIRQTLENSGSQMVTLEEELEQLKLYMELEALRFSEPFDFTVSVDDSIDPSFDRIPPMLLQPFLENAVWHGLAHKAEKGEVMLFVAATNGKLHCTIRDNGVGREASAKLKSKNSSNHKSMGIQITRDRLQMLSGNTADNLKITDVFDKNGAAAGTMVELWIPMG